MRCIHGNDCLSLVGLAALQRSRCLAFAILAAGFLLGNGSLIQAAPVPILNPSFELEDTTVNGGWTSIFVDWNAYSAAVQDAGFNGGPANPGGNVDGDQYAYMNPGFGYIFQDYVLPADFSAIGYELTVSLATRTNSEPGDAAGGGMIDVGFELFDSNLNFKYGVLTLVDREDLTNAFQPFSASISGAGAAPGDVLRFLVRKGADVNGITVDNVQLTAVPEPGSLALMVLGGVGVAAIRRRRRQG